MCARMYVGICMHQHICMLLHSPCTYTSVFVMKADTWIQNACSYICRYMHASTCMYVYTFSIYIHISIFIMRVDTWIQNVCLHVCSYMHASTCVYVYTFSIYIHICIYHESGYVDSICVLVCM